MSIKTDIYDRAAHSFAAAAGPTLLASPVLDDEQRAAVRTLTEAEGAPAVVDYERARTAAAASCPGGCADGVQDVRTLLSRAGVCVTDAVGMQTSHGRVCTGTYVEPSGDASADVRSADDGGGSAGPGADSKGGGDQQRRVDVAVKIMPLVRDRDWLALWQAHRSGDGEKLGRLVDSARRALRDPANGAFVEIAVLKELETERRRRSGCTGWPRFVGAALACARAGWRGSGVSGAARPWSSMYAGRKAAREHAVGTVTCAEVGVPVVVCVMEKLGHDLHRHVAKHGLAESARGGGRPEGARALSGARPRDIVPLLGHALSALHVASARLGLVHNDLHCSNILIRGHLIREHGGEHGAAPARARAPATGDDAGGPCMLVLFPQPQENGGLMLPFPHGAEAVIIDFGRSTLRSDAAALLSSLRAASLGGGASPGEAGAGGARTVSSEVAGFARRWDVHHTGADAALFLSCMLRYWPSLGKQPAFLPSCWDDPSERALASWIRTAMTCERPRRSRRQRTVAADGGTDSAPRALDGAVRCIERALRRGDESVPGRDGSSNKETIACEHWIMNQLRHIDGSCPGVRPLDVLLSDLFERYRVRPEALEAATRRPFVVAVVRLPPA